MLARLTLAICMTVLAGSLVQAQQSESNEATRRTIFEIGEIEIPEGGDVTDMVEFLDEMSGLQREIAAKYREAMTKITAAQAEASNKILENADEVSDDVFAKAASFGLAARVRGAVRAEPAKQRKVYELVKRQLTIGLDKGMQQADVSNASLLVAYVERYGDTELALEACNTFADLLKRAKHPNYQRYAQRFESTARRLALLGNPIELSGQVVDGSEFDWESYRGKVVLVDYWATWCGPCIAEAPNVRMNYEKYHDLGFEVVGISLDSSRDALQAYIEREDVPWENLFQEGAGWKHPMAVKYGITSIPSVFLVDKEGNVVSLQARGEELGEQLEKLLGPVKESEPTAAE